MKKIILVALASLPMLASAQNFKLLATDGTADAHSFSTDATELAYTFSTNNDSLYVKITHDQIRPADFGFMLALDTNLDPIDGSIIHQRNLFGTPNTSMQYDILLFGYQNGSFPGVHTEAYVNGSPTVVNFSLDTVDPHFSVFRIPLSELAGKIDFNLIAFTGGFDISVSGPSDAIPNSVYSEIRGSHVGLTEPELNVGIYPNPATNFFQLEQSGNVNIYNTQGTLVKSIEATAGKPIDCSDLAAGLYHVKFNDHTSAGKLIVQ